MAVTYNRLLLDIKEKPNDIITAVQNDTNSRYLDVFLYDNGVPINLDGCEVKIFMNKPEKGGEVWNNGVITDAENGRCEFLLTTEALTHFGHMQVQISIWKENVEILSTQIFEIIVTKSLVGNSSVEASNEYGTLVILFQNLYEAYDLMIRMVENIGVPAEVAAQYDLATMWQAWEFLVAYMKGDLTTLINQALANASVQGVLDLIGTTANSGGTATAGTVMAKLNALLGNQKVVKSVQRGATSVASKKNINVTIEAVDMEKAFVNVHPNVAYIPSDGSGGGAGMNTNVCGGRLTSPTTLEIIGNTLNSGYVLWEVIEFY